MATPELYWKQSFDNFDIALAQLYEADQLSQHHTSSHLEILGLIHTFDYTCDRAQAALRDYLTAQGAADLKDARHTLSESFNCHLVADSKGWIEMLSDRRRSSLVYDQAIADKISGRVLLRYVPLFRQLSAVFDTLRFESTE